MKNPTGSFKTYTKLTKGGSYLNYDGNIFYDGPIHASIRNKNFAVKLQHRAVGLRIVRNR